MDPIKSPGVYISEQSNLPPSVAGVAMAVPAFIGYTPNDSHEGQSLINVPKRIDSLQEFVKIFGAVENHGIAHRTQFYVQEIADNNPDKNYLQVGDRAFSITPDPATVYYLYNSLKLFYNNGGGTAYIVSTGTYGAPSGKGMGETGDLVNPNIQLSELLKGLKSLEHHPEPTIYACPDANLLSTADNATLLEDMLKQSERQRTVFSVLDVAKGRNPDPILYGRDIQEFRENLGTSGLQYGAVYYPYLETTVVHDTEVTYRNLYGGDLSRLMEVLSPKSHPNEGAVEVIKTIANNLESDKEIEYNRMLTSVSPLYVRLMGEVKRLSNILPPSGAIAGIINAVDNDRGIWSAPANVSLNSVVRPTLKIDENMQEGLNIDTVSGKSVNAIRLFPGLGVMVWGARTLAGNDNEWRYINVRRTANYIEASCQRALESFVFEPNDANTWTRVKAMIENFMTNLWQQGGLSGATPSEAYYVNVGIGTTMMQEDITNGIMMVHIAFAPVHPAEFIILNLSQQMGAV